MMTKAFDRIKAGLEDAIAHAQGHPTNCVIHTPEDFHRRAKQRLRCLLDERNEVAAKARTQTERQKAESRYEKALGRSAVTCVPALLDEIDALTSRAEAAERRVAELEGRLDVDQSQNEGDVIGAVNTLRSLRIF